MELAGRLDAPLAVGPGLPAGPVKLAVSFVGGDAPELTTVRLHSGEQEHAYTDEGPAMVAAVMDALHDTSFVIEALTDGKVAVNLGHDIEAILPAGARFGCPPRCRATLQRPDSPNPCWLR